MGKDRDYRVMIPGAVLLLAYGLIVLAANGFHAGFLTDSIAGQWVTVLIAVLVTSYAGGFLCGNFVLLCLNGKKNNWRNVEDLRNALETAPDDKAAPSDLWAQAHHRFHLNARVELVDFCTRRNTTMYACYGSAVALVAGLIAGLASLQWGWKGELGGQSQIAVALASLGIVALAVILWFNGTEAKREHWQVFLKSL